MAGGRPPIDIEKVQLDMLAWSLLPTSTNLCGFSGQFEIPPSVITRYARTNEEFSATYEIVKARLAQRREEGLVKGTVHQKAYDLNAKTYDGYLKAESRDDIDYDTEKKKEMDTHKANLNKNLNDDFQEQFKKGLDGVLKDIKQLQNDHTASNES